MMQQSPATITAPPEATESDMAIRLSGISKVYNLYRSKQDRLKEALHPRRKRYHKEFYALKNIDLEVKKGEVLGIVGRNGCGKSTLLKVISKVLTPTSGTLHTKGKIIALLELGTGFNPEFTGLENIYFYCSLLGYRRRETEKMIDDILDFAELDDFIDQPIKTYSSGMKARLGFSVAVNVDPEILILDEVLSVGDELFRRKCYARMEEFFKGGKTVLFVSHSIQTVKQLCTSAILLDRGEIILEGPTKLVATYYQNYLFTKKENMEKFRNKIIQINKNETLKHSLAQDSATDGQTDEINETEVEHQRIEADPERMNHKSAMHAFEGMKQDADYITDFKPSTKKIVKNRDVKISDVEIRALNGRKVNVLNIHEDYILSYKVDFNLCAQDVFVAYSITDEKGLVIINCNTRAEPLEKIITRDRYLIEWRFSCLLMPKTYYVNVGVGSQAKNEVFFQIMDAMAFKVISPVKLTYGGIVNFYKKPIITNLLD